MSSLRVSETPLRSSTLFFWDNSNSPCCLHDSRCSSGSVHSRQDSNCTGSFAHVSNHLQTASTCIQRQHPWCASRAMGIGCPQTVRHDHHPSHPIEKRIHSSGLDMHMLFGSNIRSIQMPHIECQLATGKTQGVESSDLIKECT